MTIGEIIKNKDIETYKKLLKLAGKGGTKNEGKSNKQV